MIKLSDIIKSGGGNAKINRFINRYVLSKKEKKDIVEAIKEGGKSENVKKEYEYYRIINSFNEWSGMLSTMFHMTWIDTIIDTDTHQRIWGELGSPITGSTAIAKIRKGVYKNTASYDDRWVGTIINFSQMGTSTFKEIFNAIGYDDETFNQTFTALTPEEITEIENKITFRDPLI